MKYQKADQTPDSTFMLESVSAKKISTTIGNLYLPPCLSMKKKTKNGTELARKNGYLSR